LKGIFMPNISRVNGFRVVGSMSGAGPTGKTQIYYVSSAADEILVGDVVKQGGSTDANGIPTADLCGATDVPIGIVVGVMHSKFDPVGKMNSGSVALDLPAAAQIAASGAGYILVNTDPQIIMEVETGNDGTPIAAADFGLNASHANGTRTASTTTSPAYIDLGTEATTSTLNFQILGLVQRVGNEIGASAKVLVRFNRHQYQSVGTTGI
jgi:hypothetical protein